MGNIFAMPATVSLSNDFENHPMRIPTFLFHKWINLNYVPDFIPLYRDLILVSNLEKFGKNWDKIIIIRHSGLKLGTSQDNFARPDWTWNLWTYFNLTSVESKFYLWNIFNVCISNTVSRLASYYTPKFILYLEFTFCNAV